MKITKITTLLSVALCLGFINTLSAQTSSSNEKVTVQLQWKHQFQFAGYYAAIEKGYYSDVGLDVHLVEAPDEGDSRDAVFEGEAEFGITNSDFILLRSEGKGAVLLASIFQHSSEVLIAKKDSGIETVMDIKGKRIAMEPNAVDIRSFLEQQGVPYTSLDIQPHSLGVSELVQNDVDVISAYLSDEPFLLREQGIEFSVFNPRDYGIDFYGDVLFTTEELMKDRPELALKFREATLKGWEYAMNNIDEMIDTIYENYSTRHSKAYLLYEADQMMDLIDLKTIEAGYSNPEKWQRIIDIYTAQGMLANKVDLTGFFYHDYLAKDD